LLSASRHGPKDALSGSRHGNSWNTLRTHIKAVSALSAHHDHPDPAAASDPFAAALSSSRHGATGDNLSSSRHGGAWGTLRTHIKAVSALKHGDALSASRHEKGLGHGHGPSSEAVPEAFGEALIPLLAMRQGSTRASFHDPSHLPSPPSPAAAAGAASLSLQPPPASNIAAAAAAVAAAFQAGDIPTAQSSGDASTPRRGDRERAKSQWSAAVHAIQNPAKAGTFPPYLSLSRPLSIHS